MNATDALTAPRDPDACDDEDLPTLPRDAALLLSRRERAITARAAAEARAGWGRALLDDARRCSPHGTHGSW